MQSLTKHYMGLTILEVLQNAEINLNNGGLGLMLAKQQLHNGIDLLEKGYSAHESFDALVDAHGSVESVPDKP